MKALMKAAEQLLQQLSGEGGWRSAADEHRLDRDILGVDGHGVRFTEQRVHIGSHGAILPGVGGEIAVAAFLSAIGDVYVEFHILLPK